MPRISGAGSARRAVPSVVFVRERPSWLATAVAAFAVIVPAGSGCGEAFSGSGGTGAGTTTSSSSSTHTGGSGNATTTGTGTGTGTGSGGHGGSGTGGASGCDVTQCEHPPCEAGPPLGQNCSSCVMAVCSESEYSSCCTLGWDSDCIVAYHQQTESCGDPAAPLIGCNEQYGERPGYELCSQTQESCVFLVATDPSQMACDGHCKSEGGRCLLAWTGSCDGASALACNATGPEDEAQYCSCTVGCNGEAPCLPNLTCLEDGCSNQRDEL